MMNDNSSFHPFYSYTFDGYTALPMPGMSKQGQIHNINDLFNKRPAVANGVYKLFKEDLETIYINNKKSFKVSNNIVNGKDGFVLFTFYDMPDSQDTKTIYSAYVILGETGITNSFNIIKTCKTPYLMYMNKQGVLLDYKGPLDTNMMLNFMKRVA